LLISLIVFSCAKSKKNYNDFEIIIEKKRIDSINFEAKVIVTNKSNKKKEEIFILNDTEIQINAKVNALKEKLLQNKIQ
jgi:hypothetical protein